MASIKRKELRRNQLILRGLSLKEASFRVGFCHGDRTYVFSADQEKKK